MKHHKTQNVIIEKAAVDVEMADIVKALNSNGCIRTLFCCQGTLKKDSNYLFEEGTCYVLMDITSLKSVYDLTEIVCKGRLGTLEIFWQADAMFGRPMWSIQVKTIEKREQLKKALIKWTKEQ